MLPLRSGVKSHESDSCKSCRSSSAAVAAPGRNYVRVTGSLLNYTISCELAADYTGCLGNQLLLKISKIGIRHCELDIAKVKVIIRLYYNVNQKIIQLQIKNMIHLYIK